VGCQAAASQNSPKRNKKEIHIMTSKVLRDLSFSRNQPLKSPDDQYITILKNKLTKLKNRKTGHCD
jgi:hypothetical protein